MQILLYTSRLTVILLLFAFVSCQKFEEPVLEVKVLSPENLPFNGALLDVLDDTKRIASPNEIKSTSSDGLVRFNLGPGKKYYVYLVADQAYTHLGIGNPEATYISDGVFKTQEEINNSPHQIPTPKVGDTKYFDINGDGAINKSDLVLPISNFSSKKVVKVNIALQAK